MCSGLSFEVRELARSEERASRAIDSFHLRKGFWIATAVLSLGIVITARPPNVESAIGALFICIVAMVPTWLWITKVVGGLPLFPLYAGTHIYAFALPLLYEHPIVVSFPPDAQLIAALSVSGYLLIATLIWFFVGRGHVSAIQRCLVLTRTGAEFFFIASLVIGAIYNIANAGGWLPLPPELNSAVRAILLALEALSAFALSFRSGSRGLSLEKGVAFRIALVSLIVSTLPGLLLINAISICAVSGFGYTLGARRFPWRIGLLALAIVAFLHAGKGTMREIYWKEDQDPAIQLWNYPSFIAQWMAVSWTNTFGGDTESEEHQSLMERASLMQLLLYVQTMTPDEVPYLDGATYAVIPSLIIPRFLSPNKPASHEGTYLLNIHYGFQTREDTARTTIGFGLLNEACANFGFAGMGGLAVLIGAFYATVAKWARGTPVLSFRSLFAAIVASYSFQSEFASGVYLAALFQSTVALCGLAVLFMRTSEFSHTEKSILE